MCLFSWYLDFRMAVTVPRLSFMQTNVKTKKKLIHGGTAGWQRTQSACSERSHLASKHLLWTVTLWTVMKIESFVHKTSFSVSRCRRACKISKRLWLTTWEGLLALGGMLIASMSARKMILTEKCYLTDLVEYRGIEWRHEKGSEIAHYILMIVSYRFKHVISVVCPDH